MDIRELNYIITIAKEGSISKAAEKLFMAQSSLSQFLSKLESELSTVLFVRTANGVRPTYAGEVFIESAKEMSDILRNTKNRILDIEFLRAGRVELGISTFRGMYLLPKVLKKFRALYPHVEVHICEADSEVLVKKTLKGELDMALIAHKGRETEVDDVKYIMQDEIIIVCSADDSILGKVNNNGTELYIDESNLGEYTYLLSPPSTVLGHFAKELFKRHSITPKIANDNLSAFFASSMASQGLGLAFTYNSCKSEEHNQKYIRINEKGSFVDLALIYPPGKYKSYATKILSELMSEYYNTI